MQTHQPLPPVEDQNTCCPTGSVCHACVAQPGGEDTQHMAAAKACQPSNHGSSDSGPAGPSSLSLVLYGIDPAGVARIVSEAERALGRLSLDYEILVIGTEDPSPARRGPPDDAISPGRVRYLPGSGPSSYAAALQTGLASATHPLIVFTSGSLDFTCLAYVVPLAERFPVVCAYRTDGTGSAWRRGLTWGYNTLAHLLLATTVRDCEGSAVLSVFHRAALADVLPECDRAFAHTEVLARARQRGLAIAEVAVPGAGQARPSHLSWHGRAHLLADLASFWWCRVQFPGHAPLPAGKKSWLAALVLMVLASFLLFNRLGQPLLDPDEGRQAEIPREMLAHHDLLVPRIQGAVYYEKPPLQYWLTAAAYTAFGTYASSARLVPAGAAWLSIFMTFLWGRRFLGSRTAVLSALVLCLSPAFLMLGRTVVLDSLLACCVLAAWCSAHRAVCRGPLCWRWWLASAVVCGFGMLAKGPVALALLAPPVWLYQAVTVTAARPRWKPWAVYGSVALAVAAPWYVVMAVREPHYLKQFFWHANVLRFVHPFDHEQPWWFYLPVLFVVTFPWSLLWPALAYFLTSRHARLALLRTPALGFCALAGGWCLLFFSLSGCKSPPYLAPVLAPLALLIGACLDSVLFWKRDLRHRYLAHVRQALPRWATLGVLGVAAGCYLTILCTHGVPARPTLDKLLLVLLAAALWWRYGRHARCAAAWSACAAATLFLVGFAGREAAWNYAARHSPVTTAIRARHWPIARGCPVVLYGRSPFSAYFYFRSDALPSYDKDNLPGLLLYLLQQPRALVLVDSGPILQRLLAILPSNLEAQVQLPRHQGQTALVFVQHRPLAEFK